MVTVLCNGCDALAVSVRGVVQVVAVSAGPHRGHRVGGEGARTSACVHGDFETLIFVRNGYSEDGLRSIFNTSRPTMSGLFYRCGALPLCICVYMGIAIPDCTGTGTTQLEVPSASSPPISRPFQYLRKLGVYMCRAHSSSCKLGLYKWATPQLHSASCALNIFRLLTG